ncbi:MAG TPA: UbiX family flavin prenyltransferase [Candidatus Polarisedimenticolia bacterium]|nr:UbiX family flavin prenyltransferase [Candidatus Polarisedimenticolia bacterium]
MKQITVAVTGASGSACARRLLAALVSHPDVAVVNAVMSASALAVARQELGPKDAGLAAMRAVLAGSGSKVRWYDEADVGAPIASGSNIVDATAVVPCSTGTLGAIATGATRNLIHRAAEVALKERRRLILGVREAPLSMMHLENMLAVTRAGAVVLPITPAFYTLPKTIEDVVDQYVGRVLDHLGLTHTIGRRWGG